MNINANYTKEINSHVSEMVNQRKFYSIKLVIFLVSVNDNNLFESFFFVTLCSFMDE